MADRQGFAEKRPRAGQIVAKSGWVAAINVFGERQPQQVVFVKVMGVFGGQLHRVPEKRVVLCGADEGNDASKKWEQLEKRLRDDYRDFGAKLVEFRANQTKKLASCLLVSKFAREG